jgi:IS1 transposase
MGWDLEQSSELKGYIIQVLSIGMTRVEGENTRFRHYLARLHRKTLCYSKSKDMLAHSVKLLVHYLKFWDVPIPYSANYLTGDQVL